MNPKDYWTGLDLLKPKWLIARYWIKYRFDSQTTARAFLWGQMMAILTENQKAIYQALTEVDLSIEDLIEDLDMDRRTVKYNLAVLEAYQLVRQIHGNPIMWRSIDYISKE